jgi:GNAT superfamily N-acetyltransferase
MTSELEIITIGRADEALLEAFYRGIYWDAFATQHEPLANWHAALWGTDPGYRLTIQLAGHRLRDPAARVIAGGIAFERYPRSRCGLVTYMVVAPPARRRGLGRQLQLGAVDALHAAGCGVVFGELNDPRRHGAGVDEPIDAMWRRLERNLAWGARVVDVRYVQPALGPGLARDHGLCLVALAGRAPLPPTLSGDLVRAFVDELYVRTEGRAPSPELLAGIAGEVGLIAPRR